MSDFTSDIWNFYVIGIVVAGIITCIILLWSHGSATFTPGQVTGHKWDETLEEYNNPLPKWWSGLFVLTVVFAIVYLALFPGLGAFGGFLGWTSAEGPNSQWAQETSKAEDALKDTLDAYLAQDLPTLASNSAAMATGKRLFQSYCIQCHASDGKGQPGFPNLTDDNWQFGGEPATIEETIANGRQGVMTPHADLLDAESIKDIANYVLSLSHNPAADANRIIRGQQAFAASDCTNCHGSDAKGSAGVDAAVARAYGAPNLTSGIWLYSSAESTIIEGITNGRQNRMPAWEGFLGKGKVHLLAAYVYSLSH
ncbi:MAG: cytochrome-c oxidase, cbb3-type subunit III [Zoogloeaceae bacterium]|jgi:cytochrome c oxidase cbb3-type subunit 3|nr:cytochrome-c oxidase, cbb3-type subunit III [Zoogloeaceae bacterium]